MKLASISYYPVKSTAGHEVSEADVLPWGLAGDRRFLIADAGGRTLTARAEPRLLSIVPLLDGDALTLTGPHAEPLTVTPSPGALSPVTLWGREVELTDCGDDAAAWLAALVGRPGRLKWLGDPPPRPDDISLAIQSINEWAVRQLRDADGSFRQNALAAATPDQAAVAFRSRARRQWNRYLTRKLAWSSLRDEEKTAFTWDQLVVMWQVIGRLVRGGVPARVVFVDAAFSPREAGFQDADTPDTSLLASMREVLAPYFEDAGTAEREPAPIDKSLVRELYEPLYRALVDMG